MSRSPKTAAFRAEEEPQAVRDAYGEHAFGRGCLMARRLVETGVPFVEVTHRGYDTHRDNFPKLRQLLPELDQGMSALLDDLDKRGLLESTLVVWMGDFGRTPRVNGNGGRDHWPRAASVVFAGGGVRGGQVIGSTDRNGEEIRERPVTVAQLYRTIATSLALDADKTRITPAGRPVKTFEEGAPIQELL